MKINKVFWASGIHPFNSPLPFAQNGKRNLKIFKTIPTAVGKKKRNTSANNEYPVTAFSKASTQIFLPLRYRKTSDTHNVIRNSKNIFLTENKE